MNTIEFNINNYVHVRLTDHGRRCLRKSYDDLVRAQGGREPWKYTPPKEDADGWSKWQLHELMNSLGEHLWVGAEPVFETTIRFEVPFYTELQAAQNEIPEGYRVAYDGLPAQTAAVVQGARAFNGARKALSLRIQACKLFFGESRVSDAWASFLNTPYGREQAKQLQEEFGVEEES